MRKFKATWTELVRDEYGEPLYHEGKSQIIEAENEHAACDIWEKENEFNDGQNGLEDCVELVECDLFKKLLYVDMPDGLTYGLNIENIIREHARLKQHDYDNDITRSLVEGSIPFFSKNESYIKMWAKQLEWEFVKHNARQLTKKVTDDDMENAWFDSDGIIK